MQPAPINTEDNVRDYPRVSRTPPDPGIAFPSGRYLAQLLRAGGRRLAGAYRRRRRLLLTPIMVMVPLSLALAFLLPRTFETSALLLLQETARNNPLTDPVPAETLQQKVPGLEALLKSDQVLTRVVRDMQQNGSRRVSSGDLPASIMSLRKALSVELIGTDFLAVRLRGSSSQGLESDLSIVLGAFLEALLSEPATSASQVVLSKQQQYVTGLEQRRREIQDEIAAAPARDGASSPVRSADLQRQLAALEQQIAKARDLAEALSRRYPTSNAGAGSGILSAPGRIKIVDPPKDPLPTTSRVAIVLAGSVAGILLGIMLAWAAELFDPIIYDTDDLVAAAGVPLLAVLSRPSTAKAAATLPFAVQSAPHRWIPVVIFAAVVVLCLIYLGSSDSIQRQWRSWLAPTSSQSMLDVRPFSRLVAPS